MKQSGIGLLGNADAVRHPYETRGRSWTRTCLEWQIAREYAFDVPYTSRTKGLQGESRYGVAIHGYFRSFLDIYATLHMCLTPPLIITQRLYLRVQIIFFHSYTTLQSHTSQYWMTSGGSTSNDARTTFTVHVLPPTPSECLTTFYGI